jgi:hypothetical protein
MPDPANFTSQDEESRRNREQYEAMIEAINIARNPDSNTVLVIDDELGIRRFVKRGMGETPGAAVSHLFN